MIYQKVLLMHGERVETDTVEGVSQEGGFEALRGVAKYEQSKC
jgi:hypothetical protein